MNFMCGSRSRKQMDAMVWSTQKYWKMKILLRTQAVLLILIMSLTGCTAIKVVKLVNSGEIRKKSMLHKELLLPVLR